MTCNVAAKPVIIISRVAHVFEPDGKTLDDRCGLRAVLSEDRRRNVEALVAPADAASALQSLKDDTVQLEERLAAVKQRIAKDSSALCAEVRGLKSELALESDSNENLLAFVEDARLLAQSSGDSSITGQGSRGNTMHQGSSGNTIHQSSSGGILGQSSSGNTMHQSSSGGIIGQSSSGDIRGQSSSGGISGLSPSGGILDQSSGGNISGQSPSGGIVGQSSMGSIFGQRSTSNIMDQSTRGDIFGQSVARQMAMYASAQLHCLTCNRQFKTQLAYDDHLFTCDPA